MSRILVVEDSATQAAAARAILESAGYEVEVAPTGEEGLEMAIADQFDVVISDIMMPGMNGYELCSAIKTNPGTASLPVVLLTTLNDPTDIIQGLESGADNFLTKPYDPEYLIDRVNTLFENRMLRAHGKMKVGVEVVFLGKKFTVTSDREQILDLLVATFEDVVRANRSLKEAQAELTAAKRKIEEYAIALEGRVRSSDERYHALLQQASDAIFVLNTDGVVVSANAKAEEIWGGFAVGCNVRDRSAFGEASFERILSERSVQETDVRIQGPQGETRVLDYSASVTRCGEEELVLAIVRDVTEQRELERKFHQSQKMEAVARLAGGAAHDFNNVLMAIQTFSDLLLRKIGTEDPSLIRPVEQIRKATARGAWLTGQLLAFTRGTGRSSVSTDANAVIRNLQPMLQELVGEAISFELSLREPSAMVRVDPGQIEQIVMNLVVNARDAMPGGGVITLETACSSTDADTHHPHSSAPECITIGVGDTGRGMSPEVAQQLFEPFFTTKEKGRGTGLGLSIVDTIVREAGGRILVKTAPGEGTTFTIELPLERGEEEDGCLESEEMTG